MNKKYFKYKAFTLAEVLITLLIIGVIASLIIPSLIQDTQDAELKTAWKKSYSIISQATNRILSDNAGSLIFSDSTELKSNYLQYLSYTMSCTGTNWGGNCWHKPGSMKYYNGAYLTSTDMTGAFGSGPALILNDGTLIIFNRWDCSASNFCGHIEVDVNGFKTPNTTGKDIFRIWILKNQIQPDGSPTSPYPGTCPSNSGWSCSVKYLY